jgi:hypothetical protein
MQISDRFGPIPVSATLDANGNGTVVFQVNGKNARITTLFVKASTSTKQAVCTLYKGQVGDSNVIGNTNSGSTGAPAWGQIDLLDGETLYVVWRGGDVGAVATATFVGVALPFDQIGAPYLQWSDPIAAGDGSLIYPALKSPNYVAGSVGWQIDRLGNAEFNDVSIRGSLHAEAPNGAYVDISNTLFGGGEIDFMPSDFTDPTIQGSMQPGYIQGSKFQGATNGTYLKISSPSIGLSGSPASANPVQMFMYSGTWEGSPAIVEFQGLAGANPVSVLVDGTDIGKGWIAGAGITTSNTPVNATETTQLTAKNISGNSATYQAGRIYKVVVTGGCLTGGTTVAPLFRIRKTNPAGQQIDAWRAPCVNASQTYPANYITYFQVGTTDIVADIVVTLVGTGVVAVQLTAAPTSVATVNIYDDGATPSRTWVPTLI